MSKNLNFFQHVLRDLEMAMLYEQLGNDYSENNKLKKYLDSSSEVGPSEPEVRSHDENGNPIVTNMNPGDLIINGGAYPTDKNSSTRSIPAINSIDPSDLKETDQNSAQKSIYETNLEQDFQSTAEIVTSNTSVFSEEIPQDCQPESFSLNTENNTRDNQDLLKILNCTSSFSEARNNFNDSLPANNPGLDFDCKTNYSDKAIYGFTAGALLVPIMWLCYFIRNKLSPSKPQSKGEIKITDDDASKDSLNPSKNYSESSKTIVNTDNKSLATNTTSESHDDISEITIDSSLGDDKSIAHKTNELSIQGLASLICSKLSSDPNQNQLITLINTYTNNHAKFDDIFKNVATDEAISSEEFLSQYINEQPKEDLLPALYQEMCRARQSNLVIKFIDNFNRKSLDFTTNDKIIYKAPIKYDLNDVIEHILQGNEDTATHWHHILPLALKYSKSEIIQLYAASTCPALEGRYNEKLDLENNGNYTILNLCLGFAIGSAQVLSKKNQQIKKLP